MGVLVKVDSEWEVYGGVGRVGEGETSEAWIEGDEDEVTFTNAISEVFLVSG